jgi:hypothetical protein
MSKSQSTGRSKMLRVGLAAGAAVVTALAVTAAPAFAEPKLTLSPATGPSAGGNTVIAQAATGVSAFLASTAPKVEFQAITASVTSCSNTYKAQANIAGAGGTLTAGVVPVSTAGAVIRINSGRIAVTVPAELALPASFTTARFNMCVYDTDSLTTSTLLASAAYSIAAKPTITNITPTAGPALGGYTVNVSGTGFTSGTTATLGNVALNNITVNTAGTLLTGTAPARPAGSNIQLVLTTQGGTVTSNDPDNNGKIGVGVSDDAASAMNFGLTNGIVVTPNTAPSGSTPSLDIQGVGFSGMSFVDATTSWTTAIDATPHIALIAKSTGYGLAAAGARPISLCRGVLVLNDTELLCTLDLDNSLDPTADTATSTSADVPTGVYNVQIIQTNAATTTTAQAGGTAITSGSTFTVAAY